MFIINVLRALCSLVRECDIRSTELFEAIYENEIEVNCDTIRDFEYNARTCCSCEKNFKTGDKNEIPVVENHGHLTVKFTGRKHEIIVIEAQEK